jgi:hypothetical protein
MFSGKPKSAIADAIYQMSRREVAYLVSCYKKYKSICFIFFVKFRVFRGRTLIFHFKNPLKQKNRHNEIDNGYDKETRLIFLIHCVFARK